MTNAIHLPISWSTITNKAAYSNYMNDKSSIIDGYGARERFDKHNDVVWKTLIYEQVIEKNLIEKNPQIRSDEEVDSAYAVFSNFYHKVRENYEKNPDCYQDGPTRMSLIKKTRYLENTFIDYKEAIFLIDDLRFKTPKLNCVGLSMLYIAIGQKMGWPIYQATVKGHSFIYYGPTYTESGRLYYDIETVNGGGSPLDNASETNWRKLSELSDETKESLLDCRNTVFNQTQKDVDNQQDVNFHRYIEKESVIISMFNNHMIMFSNDKSENYRLVKFMIGKEMSLVSPLNPWPYNTMAEVLIEASRYKDAIYELWHTDWLYPDSGTFYLFYQAYLGSYRFDDAEKAIDKAIEINPNNTNYINAKRDIQVKREEKKKSDEFDKWYEDTMRLLDSDRKWIDKEFKKSKDSNK